MALVVVAFGQWIAVHAASVSAQFPLNSRSEWVKALQADSTRYDEVASAVRVMSEGPEHNSFVAIEEPWLNANTLNFFAAKERLAGRGRTYFVSPGYAQKDTEVAFGVIGEYHCRYFVTLRKPFQKPNPDFLNATAWPLLARVASDSRFFELPFRSRYGLVVYSVGGGAEPSAPPSVRPPPAAILQPNPVQGGSSALDSIHGSVRAQDGSFTVARTGMAACDGWAFDDADRSTPAEVWLELTNTASGDRQYLHAQRYLRPALASALKIPSVAGAGFRCDPVVFRLQPGTYTARIFQLDAGAAKVSGLNTYTPSPRIDVR